MGAASRESLPSEADATAFFFAAAEAGGAIGKRMQHNADAGGEPAAASAVGVALRRRGRHKKD
jgi:hypothetical protein